MEILTTECSETPSAALNAARTRPSGISLAFAHLPYTDVFEVGNYRLKCVERRFYSPFRAAEGVSVSSVVKNLCTAAKPHGGGAEKKLKSSEVEKLKSSALRSF